MSRQKPLSPSSRAKNSLRPFFNSRKERTFWREIQTVRQEAGRNDYPALCAIVESNQAYSFPGLGNTFPTEEKKIPNPDFGLLKPLHLSNEIALQIARLNHHSIKLNSALISLANINHHIVHQQFADADGALVEHKEAYGLSLIVLKKELLIALEREHLPGLSRRYKKLMAGCQNTAWALLAHYLYDLIDPTYDPTRAIRRWLRIADGRVERHPWYARILQDDILTRSPTSAALSSSLLRFSSLSLLDLAILVWRKKNAHPGDEQIQAAFFGLDSAVRITFEEKFSTQPIKVSRAYNRPGKALPDIEIFRTSFCFDDIASVVAWRCQINRLIFAERPDEFSPRQDTETSQLDEAANEIARTPKAAEEVISRLEYWEKAFLSEEAQLGTQKFLSATLVAESARRIAEGSSDDPNAIAHLLATTDDIQLFVSSKTLKALIGSEIGNQSSLLTFVLWEMIYRQSRTQDNELDRRLAFMRFFKDNPNIVQILDEVAEFSSATAALLARTCSRTFLERLFTMMSSVKDVLETRLLVCRWLIDQGDPASDNLQEECDALVRELANLEARSDLDSTRVHVDEESLREWFESMHSASVTRYKQTVLAEEPSATFGTLLTFFSNKEKPDPKVDDFTTETQIGSEFLLVAIVDATLKSFVSDRTFGLDAYLSRRIRHGTLNGHVMTPITRVLGRLLEDASSRTDAQTDLDFLVICALDEERDGFQCTAVDKVSEAVVGGLNVHFVRLAGEREYFGGLMRLGQMGLVAATFETAWALNVFRTNVLCMSGICAGFSGEVNLGQLVVGSPAWEYQAGKWSKNEFEIAPTQIPLKSQTRSIIDHVLSKESFSQSLETGIDASCARPSLRSRAVLAPFATGSAVIADAKRLAHIEKQHRKVAALDMETFGMYFVAHEAPANLKHYFSIKCVVDLADSTKGDDLHKYGCSVSARATEQLLRELLKGT